MPDTGPYRGADPRAPEATALVELGRLAARVRFAIFAPVVAAGVAAVPVVFLAAREAAIFTLGFHFAPVSAVVAALPLLGGLRLGHGTFRRVYLARAEARSASIAERFGLAPDEVRELARVFAS